MMNNKKKRQRNHRCKFGKYMEKKYTSTKETIRFLKVEEHTFALRKDKISNSNDIIFRKVNLCICTRTHLYCLRNEHRVTTVII